MNHSFSCTQYSYIAAYPDGSWHHVFARFQLTVVVEDNIPQQVWVERFGSINVSLCEPCLLVRTLGLTIYLKDLNTGVKFQVNLTRSSRLALLRLLRMCNVQIECRAIIGQGPSSGYGRPSSMDPMLMSEMMYSGPFSGM